VAGLGAVVFYSALELATKGFLGELAGYRIPTPFSEGNAAGSAGYTRPWAIPLVTTLGGLLAGLLVFRFAPEAEGHGTDAAIAAVHDNPRGIRVRAVVVKILASAITIGSGGSAGREGPTAQISAGFGSLLARALDLSPSDGRIAVAAGIGSGIGAIFGAPLGGALLSAEVIYRNDVEVDAIIPSVIASVVGYSIFGAIETFTPMFGDVGRAYRFVDPVSLGWFALLGVVAGAVGIAYAKTFYFVVDRARSLELAGPVRTALGGLGTGLVALAFPEVLGTGYGWVQRTLGASLLGIPLWVVLLVPLAHVLTTALSIGSGGSGGIFGPGIVIGAFTGAATWRLLHGVAPALPASPVAFVVVGMVACFGSVSRAPLSVLLMVVEMTGTIAVVPPAMLAVGVASLMVRRLDVTIYRSQLSSRDDLPARRLAASLPLLATTPTTDAMAPPRLVLPLEATVAEAAERLKEAHVPGAPVVDANGTFVGVVTAAQLATVDAERATRTGLGRVLDPVAPVVDSGSRLAEAAEAMLATGEGWTTVLDADRRVVGVVAMPELLGAYRRSLRDSLRRLARLKGRGAPIELEVAPGTPLDGRALRDAGLPSGTLVIALARGRELLVPRGDTVVRARDRLTVLAPPEAADALRGLVGPNRGEAGAA